ncbi:uncharacterized protein LOC107478260 [Arachis duranensis]|uniref:Uncharacterized protein LOC107478260 n=1 Tax=Arachis duranensis TaxID=130453 RepID=A0A6P4CNR0_ARADU|nr:uncharacterized protein LOC107478260 [Arachis duranensis]
MSFAFSSAYGWTCFCKQVGVKASETAKMMAFLPFVRSEMMVPSPAHPHRLLPQQRLSPSLDSGLSTVSGVALKLVVPLCVISHHHLALSRARAPFLPSSSSAAEAAGPGTGHRRRSLSRHRLTLNPAPLLPLLHLSPAAAEATGSWADRRCCLLASTLAINFLFTVSFLPAVSFLPRSWFPICMTLQLIILYCVPSSFIACAFESNEKICQ